MESISIYPPTLDGKNIEQKRQEPLLTNLVGKPKGSTHCLYAIDNNQLPAADQHNQQNSNDIFPSSHRVCCGLSYMLIALIASSKAS
mgnify:CR=1